MMDNKLYHILKLYGEADPHESLPDDAELRDELDELRSVKKVLDARPRIAAPEATVQRVLDLARADDRKPHASRHDRRPVARSGKRGRPLFVAAGSTLALLLAAGLLLLQTSSQDDLTTASVEESAPRPTVSSPGMQGELNLPPERPVADASQPRTDRREPASRERAASQQVATSTRLAETPPPSEGLMLTNSEVGAEPGLSWDDAQDVRRLHMIIDVLQGRGGEIGWEEPAVPLELLQTAGDRGRGGFHRASHPVPH